MSRALGLIPNSLRFFRKFNIVLFSRGGMPLIEMVNNGGLWFLGVNNSLNLVLDLLARDHHPIINIVIDVYSPHLLVGYINIFYHKC